MVFGFYMPWNVSFMMVSLGIVEETLLLLFSCYMMLLCTVIFPCTVLVFVLSDGSRDYMVMFFLGLGLFLLSCV